jgi:hypothetical protein
MVVATVFHGVLWVELGFFGFWKEPEISSRRSLNNLSQTMGGDVDTVNRTFLQMTLNFGNSAGSPGRK